MRVLKLKGIFEKNSVQASSPAAVNEIPHPKYMRKIYYLLICLLAFQPLFSHEAFESLKKKEGTVVTKGGDVAIRKSGRLFGFGQDFDPDISSPKSATFSKDGKKIYINSLEGCKTVVYDASTHKKLKVINHSFESGEGSLWLKPSGYYPFTHYEDGSKRKFSGKPVEAALSKDGNYLFVPYYRRSFDLNAQDPSAIAVIDTRKDEIVLMAETGPLPKMVRVSHDGKLLAITHWGDNTVGFMDISDRNPRNWHHLSPVAVGNKLQLNYSLTSAVNRDSGSGYLLRGTVFMPGDSLLVVSGMAGPLAFIDTRKMEWIGMAGSLSGVRHLTLKDSLLFMSRNSAGEVLTVPVDALMKAVASQRGNSREFKIDGVRRAKVGGGARTLKVSPEGKFIFVACNSASEIGIVRTEDMQLVGSIPADKFPVGLDISPDGRQLVSTSQGRRGLGGGNAVDFFEVEYAVPEKSAQTDNSDSTQDEAAADSAVTDASKCGRSRETHHGWVVGLALGVAALLALGAWLFFRKK